MSRCAAKRHPAWRMLAACCCIQFGGLGVLSNSMGVFFPAVCADLGFTTAQISVHITIRGIATVAALPLAGRLLARYPTRAVVTPAALTLVTSIAGMACFDALWQWYVASIFYGFAGAFLFLNLTPLLLTNWFAEKRGFAVGLAMASAGLAGIVMNPLGNAAIAALGWRATYLLFAAVGGIFILPFAAGVLERSPQDIGLQPYGARKASPHLRDDGAPQARRVSDTPWSSAAFWLLAAAVCAAAYETVYIYHFPAHTQAMGLGTMAGAFMTSASMAGNLAAKLLLGWCSDHFTARRAFLGGLCLTALGFALLQSLSDNVPLLVLGALLYGTCMALSSVCVPLVIGELFCRRRYAGVLSVCTMLTSAVGGLGTAAVGFLYDAWQSYLPVFALGQALCAVCAVLLCAAFRCKPKANQHEQT